MTTWDHYAGVALGALIARHTNNVGYPLLSEIASEVADAMVRESDKRRRERSEASRESFMGEVESGRQNAAEPQSDRVTVLDLNAVRRVLAWWIDFLAQCGDISLSQEIREWSEKYGREDISENELTLKVISSLDAAILETNKVRIDSIGKARVLDAINSALELVNDGITLGTTSRKFVLVQSKLIEALKELE